ncbi:MAG: hypothetical protein ACRDQ7_25155 [Haloechinothrix sp.]
MARTIAVIAAGSVLSLAGSGVAAASAVDSAADKAIGSSSTKSAAAKVQDFRDQLTAAADAGNVDQAARTVDELQPLLAELTAGERYAMTSESTELATTANEQATDVSGTLAEYQAGARSIPGLPDPVAMLNTLLQSLLATLASLIDSLLGGLPPLPEVPDPGLPVPAP